MSPERHELLAKVLGLSETERHLTTRQIAERLGVTIGQVAGVLRDSSDAKRHANARKRMLRARDGPRAA